MQSLLAGYLSDASPSTSSLRLVTATARFDVTGWTPSPYDQPAEGPELSRITIRKAFQGGLKGESVGEGLFCGMSAPQAGAGYVVSERFTGQLGERHGSFVIQHGGLMGPGVPPRTFGHVVPGSGTGDLVGLIGDVQIDRTDDGEHRLTLDYDFPAPTAA